MCELGWNISHLVDTPDLHNCGGIGDKLEDNNLIKSGNYDISLLNLNAQGIAL